VPYAVIPLALVLVCLWLGRRLLTLVVIFGYLSIEGTLKLLSGGNPIVHVGMDIIVLSVAVYWLMEAVITRQAGLPNVPWIRTVALFVVWVVALVFHPLSAGLYVSIASFKMHLTMIPLYLMTAAVVRTREDITRLLIALTVIALIPFVAALAQYALGPSSVLDVSERFWTRLSVYHEWRPFGTSNIPGGAAVWALLAVPAAIALVRAPALSGRTRVLAVLAVAGAAGTLAVSGVRALVIGLLLAVLVMGAVLMSRGKGRGIATVLLVVVLGAGGYVAVTSILTPIAREAVIADPRSLEIWRQQDVTQRLQTLAHLGTLTGARAGAVGRVWFRITHYPFGAGLGRTGAAGGNLYSRLTATPQSAEIERQVGWSDNYFADMISETGIPGVIMMMSILIGMMIGAARLAARATDSLVADVCAGIAGLFFAILVMSWGSQPLMSNPITAYFWMFAGVYAAARRLEAEAEASEPGPEPADLDLAAPATAGNA
jgi:hypothetical protein